MNMKAWVRDQIANPEKKPMPILSFPCVQLMGIGVKELIESSDFQSRGMKLIADRVDSAAAVSLMDLSVEAEAFGSTIRVSDDEVPTVIGAIVEDEDEADELEIPEVGAGRTGLYIESLKKAKELICDRPVFAGCIGPYSLAGRLMDVSEIMILCYDEPDMVHTVMEKVTRFQIDYCKAYRDAGADGVLIAEPLVGLLSPSLAQEFSHPYMKQLIDEVQTDDFIVIYHNCGNNTPFMRDDIYALGAAAYHFGDAIDLKVMFDGAPADALIMGNVSPSRQFLGGTTDSIREETHRIMAECAAYDNFLISSGCDIPPMAKWENIDAFFAAAKTFNK